MRLAADLGCWQLQGFGVWVVQRREDDALLGVCGFRQGRAWPRELTGGSCRGAGPGVRTGSVACGDPPRLRTLRLGRETYMKDDNTAARALVLRLGAEQVGRQRFPDGLERDLFRFPWP